MKTDLLEKRFSLRNKNTYEADLETNNVLETGVKAACVFNELKNFHVTENFYFDLMHDVLEGVSAYDVCNILLSLIETKVIDISTINSRKDLFNYGEIETGNASVPIEIQRLKKKGNLKMTASETFSFLHFLPLMLGDLIPQHNTHWQLLIKLVEIVDILFDNVQNNNKINRLKSLIKEHHELYINLYGNLKPKHHFMVHYPTAIKKCGPLKFAWVMRFEAKHKEAKAYFK